MAPATPATPSARWRIVLARDRRYDGAFVYAVRSTGVFCRPSCPSRRPRRTLVTFFTAPADAARAGFRPCRRCRPTEPDAGHELVRRACALLDAPTNSAMTLEDLARVLRAAPRPLTRAFRRVLGVTPRQYRDQRRLARLKTHLKERKHVAPALYAAGYGASSRVYEQSNARLGMTPATYARGGAGTRIAYVSVPCPLGRLLVAVTERGLCRVALGDDAAALERDLREEFPAADIQRDGTRLAGAVAALTRHLAGEQPDVALPIDVRATAFQRRVWDALRRIPYGETRTYGQIARGLGRPTAARAVARAVATNPVALVVPCHRVVPAHGAPGGYRWGRERKEALLARESARDRSPVTPPPRIRRRRRPDGPATGDAVRGRG